MNRESLLKMSIYKTHWFALENVNTDNQTYSDLIFSLNRSFIEVYGKDGAKEYVNLLEKENKSVLFVVDKKVPNIVKAIVNNNQYNISIELHGLDKDGNEREKILTKPFDQEECKEIIPCYNNYGQNNSLQRKAA